MSSREAAPEDPHWFRRWGAPTTVGLCAIVSLGVAAWYWDALAPWDAAVAATALAATLIACLAVVSGRGDVGSPVSPGRPDCAEAFMAAGAMATGVVIAAYYLDVPLRTGESMTIASYATQSFAEAASTYDQPNNHLLHTLLVWTAHQLGGWNRIVLRLPAFLAFCLFLPALWWFVRQEYGAATALFATALAATSPIFPGYAIYARGYTLLLLFFVTGLLCSRALVRAPDRKVLWALWAGTIALGLYTQPVMVFCVAMIVTWTLLVRWRRSGTDGFRQFAVRTVAWVAAAGLASGLLYLPVLVAQGVEGVHKMLLTTGAELTMGRMRVIGHPVVLWRHWHLTTPAWAQGVLLALVIVGATARGRSCGRKGTLLLASGVAWLLVLVGWPLLKESRYFIWALLVCMIMAGAGASLVLDRTRQPRRLVYAGLALVLASFTWWTTRPDAITRVTSHSPPRRSLPAMVSSVAGRMSPGDWIAVCNPFALNAVVQLKAAHAVDQQPDWYRPVANLPQRIGAYRLLPGTHQNVTLERGPKVPPSVPGTEHAMGRLVWFDLLRGDGASLCTRVAPGRELLEAEWPDHELVAAFGMAESGGSGRAWLLNDWVPEGQ